MEKKETLIDEVMWQYSLRSNLLLFGSAMAFYLLYIGEIRFLVALFFIFSIVNVITDSLYRYERASIFQKIRKGHRIAALVNGMLSIAYYYAPGGR